MHTQNTN